MSDNNLINENINMVSFVESLTGSEQTVEINHLITTLTEEYDEDSLSGKNFYEFFDMTKQEFKVHFDFDKKLNVSESESFDKNQYKEKILGKLNFIFNTTNEDYAMSEDNRKCKDRNGNRIYKVSYHFIMISKKTTYEYLIKYIKDINKLFKADGIPFDTSIYRNGITRFRMPMCKKDKENNSLMKPMNYKDDIKKHIVQCIYGCEDLLISDDKLHQIKNNICSSISIKDLLSNYEIVSTKNSRSIKYHNVKCLCPFANREHRNNHCYLVEKEDSLEICCHSDDCKDKMKVLYRKNSDFTLFDVDYFNSIKIKQGNEDNYKERRKYFESHYVYIRNTNTLYNIIYRKNSIGYYERELMEIKDKGLESYIYQKNEKQKDDTIKEVTKNFYKEYRFDQFRKNYLYTDFIPSDKADKGIYNLFNGFNYKTILLEDDEITDDDIKDVDFLTNYILTYICENNEKVYDYFISSLAMILQHPTFLNHIITVFYSSEEGTGKSSFLKFFSKILGELYSFFGSIKDITEKHSTSAVGRLINVIEELKTNKEFTEELKNYSQREKAPINDKNKTIANINCYVRYFIATNIRKCLSLKKGERRYNILKFSKIKDKTIINKMDEIYSNKKMVYLFGKYLMEYKLGKEKMKRKWWEDHKPETETYKLFVNNDNLSRFIRDMYNRVDYFAMDWVISNIKEYVKKNTIIMPKLELWNWYVKWMEYNDNGKYKGNRDEFYKKITEDHNSYIIIKSPCNIKKFYINLKGLKDFLSIEEIFINKYSEDYVEPTENEEEEKTEESEEENIPDEPYNMVTDFLRPENDSDF